MNVGRLSHRITIQKKTVAVDENGIPTENWVDFKTVWASRRELSGREYYSAVAVQMETDVLFVVRYNKYFKPTQKYTVTDDDPETLDFELKDIRLIENGLVYDVKAIVDKKDDKQWLEIRCKLKE